jgi:iron complex outermembrane receptor protein
MSPRRALRLSFLASAPVSLAIALAQPAFAQDAPPPAETAQPADDAGTIIVTGKTTRSATTLTGAEIQKILPGVSPLKAIQTLPGVLYITADPWGLNEQNAQIFIHGFAGNQLGYTMDGLPLGDQSYGNYNGLSPQRAVISENVSRVVVATGAGDLATASNSNLGGTVETYSSDPKEKMGAEINQTIGSFGTSRTYVRVDSGEHGYGNSFYLSGTRQRARAWDFNGIQGGYQANAKFVHDDSAGKLTIFFDYSDMTQPNEDATVFFKPSAGAAPATAAQLYTPYSKPFYYPDLDTYRSSYLSPMGNTPSAVGSNYRNYYSDAQRTDYLGYVRYDAHLSDKITWSTTGYYHHNDGAGVVAGPLGQSITTAQPYLDPNYATDCHFSGNGNGAVNASASCAHTTAAQAAAAGTALVNATGGSGLITRTTEYRIDREGVISALNLDLGAHKIEFGGWFEHNSTTQWRRWYAVPVGSPQLSTPYIRPLDVEQPLFTQYQGNAEINQLQLHLQDTWQVSDRLVAQAGFKTSAQWASGRYPVQPVLGSLSGLGAGGLPQGKIDTLNWFLPAVGANYEVTGHEQVYFNVQKNLRQYSAYLAGGGGPWFTGSQAAFDAFADQGKPETSWTYEGGVRSNRMIGNVGFQAQVNYYHVVFNNRLLAISTNPGGIAGSGITGGTSILVNVGNVHTDGVDAAFTLRFGRAFSLYNATSYNLSTYQSDYTSSATGIGAATGTCIGGLLVVGGVVPTCGKQLPGTPKWMNKTVATLDFGPFEVQAIGDYVGRRFATFADDTSVPSYFLVSAQISVRAPEGLVPLLSKAQLSLNVTNIGGNKGWSSLSIGSATNSYSAYPIAPRQWFLTFSAGI